MPDEIAVELKGVSKKFSRDRKLTMHYGLRDVFCSSLGLKSGRDALRPGEFMALRDVTASIRRGQFVWIMGPNGAGKSTLLKLVNGIYLPDKGEVSAKGRIAAVLDMSGGFNLELSGRENIYLSYALHHKKEIDIVAAFDKIVSFAELQEVIDAPLRTYSRGMLIRLAFSITFFMEAEIVIFDDILVVGDINFRKKCMNALAELRHRNTTVIVATQHIGEFFRAIKAEDKGLVLCNGGVVFDGLVYESIRYYSNAMDNDELNLHFTGDSRIGILGFDFSGVGSDKLNQCNYGDSGRFNLRFRIGDRRIERYTFWLRIYSRNGLPIFNAHVSSALGPLGPSEERRISIYMDEVLLIPGKYYVDISLYDEDKCEWAMDALNALSFSVIAGPFGSSASLDLKLRWESEPLV